MFGPRMKKSFQSKLQSEQSNICLYFAKVRNKIDKYHLTEDPIPAELRLAVCLYRLGRGDNLRTVSELVVVGKFTVVALHWKFQLQLLRYCGRKLSHITYYPTTEGEYKMFMTYFEQYWQFPCCFGAVDSTHHRDNRTRALTG